MAADATELRSDERSETAAEAAGELAPTPAPAPAPSPPEPEPREPDPDPDAPVPRADEAAGL